MKHILTLIAVIFILNSCKDSSQISKIFNSQNNENIKIIAVLDLNQASKELGYEKEVYDIIKKNSNALNKQLKNLQSQLNSRYETEKNNLISLNNTNNNKNKSTDKEKAKKEISIKKEDRLKLAQLEKNYSNILIQNRNKANNIIANRKNNYSINFIQKIMPVAKETAEKLGYQVLLTKNPGQVSWNANEVDITAEVVKTWNSKPREKFITKKNTKVSK